MGIILSRFRKKKTTLEVLEDLDSKIKEIEQYGQTTEQRHKKIVGRLILYSVILYIITAFIFYFYFFPASLYDQIFYIIPLLIFPILILFTKKMVSWYYKRKISYNREKLVNMQTEKKKILEEVTETETYKKAKEILMKFAPDQLRMTPLSPQPTYKSPTSETPRPSSTPQAIVSPVSTGSGELRRRVVTNQAQSDTPTSAGVVPVGVTPSQNPQPSIPLQPGAKVINTPGIGYRLPLPRPVLPRQRTYLDRVVDYLVGDGPSNRYALICRNCCSHNGMALKEEFEYFGFRCVYCNFWNPARKQKPSAPKLEFNMPLHSLVGTTQDSSASTGVETLKPSHAGTPSGSETDSDIEVVERPVDDFTDPIPATHGLDKNGDEDKSEAKGRVEREEDVVERMDVDT